MKRCVKNYAQICEKILYDLIVFKMRSVFDSSVNPSMDWWHFKRKTSPLTILTIWTILPQNILNYKQIYKSSGTQEDNYTRFSQTTDEDRFNPTLYSVPTYNTKPNHRRVPKHHCQFISPVINNTNARSFARSFIRSFAPPLLKELYNPQTYIPQRPLH